jgi:hypothetical protein
MAEATGQTGGPPARHQMTPHEMLAASARLGTFPHGAGAARGPAPAGAQQYDESGFPIRRDRASLAARVRQLLRG